MKKLIICFLFLSIGIQSSYADVKLKGKVLSLSFLVKTNVPGVEFQGHLKEKIGFSVQGEEVLITIPIDKITTGISLRDSHMRDKIFMKKDLVFRGTIKCTTSNECSLNGALDLAQTKKKMKLSLSSTDKGFRFKTSIFLDQFNIKPPGFMGVKVTNEIIVTSTFH